MAMKFRAHETFFIRKGWLSKGLRYVSADKTVFINKKCENPMDVLGIGANMVKALRYWLQAVGLTEEMKAPQKGQQLTEFGTLVFTHDRYTEEIGTLQLLHFNLVTNEEFAPSWFYFFNIFAMQEFSKDDFYALIQNDLKMKQVNVALRSLIDDFACLINTYVPKYKTSTVKESPENNIVCPFIELGLIDVLRKDHNNYLYRKATPLASTFHPWIVMAIIAHQAQERTEISLNELLTAPCNIGKVFNLDAICMLNILHEVEQLGLIKIIRTAGLDVIRILQPSSFITCVKHYYTDIKKNETNE